MQSKIFGAPAVSGNLSSRFGEFGKSIVKSVIIGAGVAGGFSYRCIC